MSFIHINKVIRTQRMIRRSFNDISTVYIECEIHMQSNRFKKYDL